MKHLIHVSNDNKKVPTPSAYEEVFSTLLQTYEDLHVWYCYSSSEEKERNKTDRYTTMSYTDIQDVGVWIVRNFSAINTYISSPDEELVRFVHFIKKQLGQPVTNQPEMFVDKNLEREVYLANAPHLVPQKIVFPTPESITREGLQGLDLPLMFKPVAGVGSRGVQKMEAHDELDDILVSLEHSQKVLDKKGLTIKDVLVEEYIEGPQYVVNYRVDAQQRHVLSLPTRVYTVQEVGYPGFANRVRIIHQQIYDELPMDKMYQLIQETISTGGIRNTYVSHNFRITHTGKLKNIELNGRMGGYRLGMNLLAAGYNLYIPMIASGQMDHLGQDDIEYNVAVYSIRPPQEGALLGYSEEIISHIESLESYHSCTTKQKMIGKQVGSAINGFAPLGTIVLRNKDLQLYRLEKVT